MKIAILGGTGKLGLAFAVRLSEKHEVALGSRDESRAREAAQLVGGRAAGMTNAEAAAWCELSLVAVPYNGHHTLIEPLTSQLRDKAVVDATVPIDPGNLLQIKTASGRSAAEETASLLADTEVYAAFHTISHRLLRQAGVTHDVLVAGAGRHKSQVMEVIRSMDLRPVDAGPLEVAGHIERMTVLLLSVNKANKVKESGIHITGV
jgi:NADPH-dependent F420 reductase